MLAFSCPHCGVRVRVDDRWAGQQVQCGGCRGVVQAPGDGSASPPVRNPRNAPQTNVPPERYDFLAPAQAADEIGRLGPYRVLKVLGRGGMGVVFHAEDPRLERSVALKVLLPALAANPVSRQRFLREARAAAAIEHDHVVTIYQVEEADGIPYLAMPLLEGESLESRLRRESRLPIREVLRIGREVAEGLRAAHERGILHRDIKPANLWLEGSRGRLKILDFGLARSLGGDSQLTTLGAIIGSPGYSAPEQIQGGRVDPRTDLFSLGCVLYRLCTGEPPFQGTDTLSTLAAVATEMPKSIRECYPAVPATLASLIQGMLAKDPAERPPSAQSVVEAIAAIEKDEPDPTSPINRTGSRVAGPARQAGPTSMQARFSRSRLPGGTSSIPEEIRSAVPIEEDKTLPLPLQRRETEGKRSRRSIMPVIAGCFVLFGLLIMGLGGVGGWWYLKDNKSASASSQAGTEPVTLAGGEPKKGEGERWTILLRSDDPSVWNTAGNGRNYAVPLNQAPATIRYLRLRRMDTAEMLILPMNRAQLGVATLPREPQGYSWNGSAKQEWGGRHLGIAQGPRMKFPIPRGTITILNAGWDGWAGSGFGHQAFNDNTGQYWAWRGQQIGRTVFEIAVTNQQLTDDEKHCLLVPWPNAGHANFRPK